MKNLLIVIAILMLGCGTDTEVVESRIIPTSYEPPRVAEEPTVTEELLPELPPELVQDPAVPVGGHGAGDPPHIVSTDVDPANSPFDPVPLNENGIFFQFDEDLGLFKVDLSHDGKSLGWLPRAELTGDEIGSSVKITPAAGGPFLEYHKEYHLDIHFEDNAQAGFKMVIKFQTIRKP